MSKPYEYENFHDERVNMVVPFADMCDVYLGRISTVKYRFNLAPPNIRPVDSVVYRRRREAFDIELSMIYYCLAMNFFVPAQTELVSPIVFWVRNMEPEVSVLTAQSSMQ